MLLEPSCNFKHEVGQVSAQIARAPNFAALATLNQHRNKIVVEALEIVHQLNIPEPSHVTSIRNPV
jgi:hypothetical protein